MDSGLAGDLSLDRIVCLSMGPQGSGKSWFSWTWPKPILLLSSIREVTAARLRRLPIPWLRPTAWEDIQSFYADPARVIEEHHPGYDAKTVVIDSVSHISFGVCMDYCKQGQEYATIKHIGYNVSKMRGLFILSSELKYNVVLIAHTRMEKNDFTGDIHELPDMYGTSMRGQAGTLTDLFLIHQEEPTKEGGREYVAYPHRFRNAMGKDRFDCLPDRMVDPNYPEIRRLIDAKEESHAATAGNTA